ncbi:MAG TPA: amidohydrolase/deacetylase family metallohydrolase [Chloroflexota bacterium]|nr:amidohydrolase/deacetylase family metallohydrolase [Chloroflexota bacterium]
MHDLVVRGGRVVDPSQGIDRELDVAIDGDQVAAVGENLAAGGARQLLEAKGLIVTPGLIDLHSHVYWGVAPLGIEPDPHCLRRGVTTAVDAGSSGASTFPGFRRYVIEVSATRILAFLHIATIGMAQDAGRPEEVAPELSDIRWARVDRAVEVARAHADLIVGIKVRLSEAMLGPGAEQCREALRRARQAAEAIGKPLMVHPGGTAISIEELLGALAPGDVLTHCYHGRTDGVLDDQTGRVRECVREAVRRGIGLDVGHGAGSFSWDVARRALEQDLQPSTISSDIHTWSVAHPAYDLATTASKLLHLGIPLSEVIRKVTERPAQAIAMESTLGTLRPGAHADVTVMRLAEGEFPLTDAHGKTEHGRRRLEPVAVVRAGRVYECTPAVYQVPRQHAHAG